MAEPEKPEEFDPYYRWLGIRDARRPPDHYRLLGLEIFEEDADVISEAADRQMGHVRTHQTGPYAIDSQRLLNELARARICLLNERKRSAYDADLRAQSAHETTAATVGLPSVAKAAESQTPPPSRGRPEPLAVKLTVISGPAIGESFVFRRRDSFTVGRGRKADFVISSDQTFSRVHFAIRVNPPVCYLKDLSNRTKVNGQEVTEAILRDGDIISGGSSTIQVEISHNTSQLE